MPRSNASKTPRKASRQASGKATRKTAARRQPADAIALLKADHREVEELLEKFESVRSDRKEAIAREICAKLSLHARLEEEALYPRAREVLRKEADLVDEAEVEHQSAKDLIARIEQMSADDDKFEATVKVLGEYVKHHVQEEEKEMFPKLKRSKLDLKALGEEIATRKDELMGQFPGAMPPEARRPERRMDGAGLQA